MLPRMLDNRPSFLEFFAGGGMARAGLGPGWRCAFSNDFDHKKAATYQANWGGKEMIVGDVRNVSASNLPAADLVWASFPCQDLSLAGGGAGLKGERSGTFWPFWSIIKELVAEGRAPKLLVLENVCGALTSHGGKDFSAICAALASSGYSFGAMVMDAALFVPHSRPRLFVVGVRSDHNVPAALIGKGPSGPWYTRTLRRAHEGLSARSKRAWLWWRLPEPAARNTVFADLIEENPSSVTWHTAAETRALLGMMSEINLAKVEAAKKAGKRMVGAIYKRTRFETGEKVQRAEVRFDDISGCLRTPAGGSSRQTIIVVDGENVRSRLISSRETARLMGLPDEYKLPAGYNEAYHLTGDGVVVPVVRHLAQHILEPILLIADEEVIAA